MVDAVKLRYILKFNFFIARNSDLAR